MLNVYVDFWAKGRIRLMHIYCDLFPECVNINVYVFIHLLGQGSFRGISASSILSKWAQNKWVSLQHWTICWFFFPNLFSYFSKPLLQLLRIIAFTRCKTTLSIPLFSKHWELVIHFKKFMFWRLQDIHWSNQHLALVSVLGNFLMVSFFSKWIRTLPVERWRKISQWLVSVWTNWKVKSKT